MCDLMPCFSVESNSAVNLSPSDTITLCGWWTIDGTWGGGLCLSYIPQVGIISNQIQSGTLLGLVPMILVFIWAVIRLLFYNLVFSDLSQISLCYANFLDVCNPISIGLFVFTTWNVAQVNVLPRRYAPTCLIAVSPNVSRRTGVFYATVLGPGTNYATYSCNEVLII